MKDLVARLAGIAVLLAALGCQNQELAPSAPPETLSFDVSTSSTTQNVVGLVSDQSGTGIAGVLVQFFDAANGELLGDVPTASDGTYDSGPLPVGDGRIRFGDPEPGPNTTYSPAFYGADGADDFCAGSVVTVAPSTTLVANELMSESSPTKVVYSSGGVEGTVVDAETGEPVSGIEVTLRNAADAVLISATTTDTDGIQAGACGELTGFISRVNVEERRGVLTSEEADVLRAQTATLQEALGCA